MQLAVTSETILAEMKGAKAILEAWMARVEEGIPGVDVPAEPDRLESFLHALCGELLIVAGKAEHLSNVLSGEV
jgi:hypothetical protein